MTQEMKQLEQMQSLTASRGRVTEVLLLMVPLVRLAAESDPLARYLVGEFDRAWDVMASENMSAAEFVAENEKPA